MNLSFFSICSSPFVDWSRPVLKILNYLISARHVSQSQLLYWLSCGLILSDVLCFPFSIYRHFDMELGISQVFFVGLNVDQNKQSFDKGMMTKSFSYVANIFTDMWTPKTTIFILEDLDDMHEMMSSSNDLIYYFTHVTLCNPTYSLFVWFARGAYCRARVEVILRKGLWHPLCLINATGKLSLLS